MYLQLAEGRRKGKVSVSGYKRKSTVSGHQRRYPLNENGTPENPYIFVPNPNGGGIFIREDKFDSMPDDQWSMFMQALAPYQPEVQRGLSEPMFLASRASRKENRERKQEAKTQKKEARAKGKEDKNQRKNDRTESKVGQRAAKSDRKAEGKGFDWDKAKDFGGSLISKFKGGGGDEDQSGGTPPGTSPGTPTNYKPFIIGGLALVLIGGAAYAIKASNKK